MFASIFLPLLTADTGVCLRETTLSPAMSKLQNICMQRVFEPATYKACVAHSPLLLEIQSGFVNVDDSCTWKGIECEDGIVTSILLDRYMYDASFGVSYIVNINWVPQTVEKLHVREIHLLNGWSPERLPRNLRYLCLWSCNHWSITFIDDEKERKNAGVSTKSESNLQELPQGLEQLYIVYGWTAGYLRMGCIPQNMRRLLICSSVLTHAFVHFEALPESLQEACVVCTKQGKTIKVRGMGRKQHDKKVRTKMKNVGFHPFALDSRVYADFCAQTLTFKAMRGL